MKKTFLLSLLTIGLFFLNSCKDTNKNNPNYIKVGITTGLEKELAEAAKKEAKEKFNLDVELIVFNDYVIPNEALQNGDIDVNVFQHVPYLEEQSKQRGYKLAVIGNTFVYPIVGYSKKIKQISELENGNTIAIPNDPTNGGRALLLLEKNGVIKLKKGIGLLPKITDITENSKNLKILEIEAPQLPRVVDDKEVSLAIINNNFAEQSGLSASEYGILVEDKDSPYVNVIVSREDNKNSEKVQKFVKAYQSEAVAQTAEKVFKKSAVKGW